MNRNIPINVFFLSFLENRFFWFFFRFEPKFESFGELIFDINLTNSASFLEKIIPQFFGVTKLKRKTLVPIACIQVIVKYGCKSL